LFKKTPPKVAGEFGITVTDDYFWQSMVPEHSVEEDFCYLRGGGCCMHWLKDGPFCEIVGENYYGIIPLACHW
jgi:hypothetical protein